MQGYLFLDGSSDESAENKVYCILSPEGLFTHGKDENEAKKESASHYTLVDATKLNIRLMRLTLKSQSEVVELNLSSKSAQELGSWFEALDATIKKQNLKAAGGANSRKKNGDEFGSFIPAKKEKTILHEYSVDYLGKKVQRVELEKQAKMPKHNPEDDDQDELMLTQGENLPQTPPVPPMTAKRSLDSENEHAGNKDITSDSSPEAESKSYFAVDKTPMNDKSFCARNKKKICSLIVIVIIILIIVLSVAISSAKSLTTPPLNSASPTHSPTTKPTIPLTVTPRLEPCLNYLPTGPFNMTEMTPEVTMRFTVQDMCLNYNGADHCFVKSKEAPFAGADMILESGAWYFNDLVTYRYIHSTDLDGEEALIVRMEVQQSHDLFRDKRAFVYHSKINPRLGCLLNFEKYELYTIETATNQTKSSGRTRCLYKNDVNDTTYESNLVDFFHHMPLFALLDVEGAQWIMASPERTGMFTADPDVNNTSQFGFLVGFNETGHEFQYKSFPSNLTTNTSAILAALANDLQSPLMSPELCVNFNNTSSRMQNQTTSSTSSDFGFFLFTESVEAYFIPLMSRRLMISSQRYLNRSNLVTNETDVCASNCINNYPIAKIAKCYENCYTPVLQQHEEVQKRILRGILEAKYEFEEWKTEEADVFDVDEIQTAIRGRVNLLMEASIDESDFEQFAQYRSLKGMIHEATQLDNNQPTSNRRVLNQIEITNEQIFNHSMMLSLNSKAARNLGEDGSGNGMWKLVGSDSMLNEIKYGMRGVDEFFNKDISQLKMLKRPPLDEANRFLAGIRSLSQSFFQIGSALLSIEEVLSKIHNLVIVGLAVKWITAPIFTGIEAGIFVLDICSKIPFFGELFGVIKSWVKSIYDILKKGVATIDTALNPEPISKYTLPALKVFESTRKFVLQGSGVLDMYLEPIAQNIGFIQFLSNSFKEMNVFVNDLVKVMNEIVNPVLDFVQKVIKPVRDLVNGVSGAQGILNEFDEFLINVRRVWDNVIGNFLLRVDAFLKITIDIPALASKLRSDAKKACVNVLTKPCFAGCVVVAKAVEVVVEAAKAAVQAVDNAIKQATVVVQAVVKDVKEFVQSAGKAVNNAKKWVKGLFGRRLLRGSRALSNGRVLSDKPEHSFLNRLLGATEICENGCRLAADIPCVIESEVIVPRFLDIVPKFTVKDILIGVSVVLSAVNPLEFISSLVKEKLASVAMGDLPELFFKEVALPSIQKEFEGSISYIKSFDFLPPNVRCLATNALTPVNLKQCSPIKDVIDGVNSITNNKVGAICEIAYMCDSSVSDTCLERCCDKKFKTPSDCSACDENGRCSACSNNKFLVKYDESNYDCITLKKDDEICYSPSECESAFCDKGKCCGVKCGKCPRDKRFDGSSCISRLTSGNLCEKDGDCLSNKCSNNICCAYDDPACKSCDSGNGLCLLCDSSEVVLADGKCQKLRKIGDACIKNNGVALSTGCQSKKCLGDYCCSETMKDSNCASCGSDGGCNKCSNTHYLPSTVNGRRLDLGLNGVGTITLPRNPLPLPSSYKSSPAVDFSKVPKDLTPLAELYDNFGAKIDAISLNLNIPREILASILYKESSGNPFSNNKVLIRVEPAAFKKNYLGNDFARYFSADTRQWRSDPTSNSWKSVYGTNPERWELLQFLQSLSDTAALRSASYGLPQIMGFNSAYIGFSSVQEMFLAFSESVEAQLSGFEKFIKLNSKLLLACQTLDYESIARYYNGPGDIPNYSSAIKSLASSYVNLFSILKISGDQGGKCSVSGLVGKCSTINDCNQRNGLIFNSGCSDASNVCCVEKTICEPTNIEQKGICKDITDCIGEFEQAYAGYCPGGKNIQCCVNTITSPPSLSPTTSAPTASAQKFCYERFKDGASCKSGTECLNNSCVANRCCAAGNGANFGCLECNSSGGCNKCDSAYYLRKVFFDCKKKLSAGVTCSSLIQTSDDSVCSDGNCKTNCCLSTYEGNCVACGTDGRCATCISGHAPVAGVCTRIPIEYYIKLPDHVNMYGGDYLVSSNRRYRLTYELNGDITLKRDGTSIWMINNPEPKISGRFIMQADGNLVAYKPIEQYYWATHTDRVGIAPYYLLLQDDGNFVIVAANGITWKSNTGP